mgnify:CR=1 FL=1
MASCWTEEKPVAEAVQEESDGKGLVRSSNAVRGGKPSPWILHRRPSSPVAGLGAAALLVQMIKNTYCLL